MSQYDRSEAYVLEYCEGNSTLGRAYNDFTPCVEQVLDTKMSVHIDGPAGAGKSTLINEIFLNYMTLAPTSNCLLNNQWYNHS